MKKLLALFSILLVVGLASNLPACEGPECETITNADVSGTKPAVRRSVCLQGLGLRNGQSGALLLRASRRSSADAAMSFSNHQNICGLRRALERA